MSRYRAQQNVLESSVNIASHVHSQRGSPQTVLILHCRAQQNVPEAISRGSSLPSYEGGDTTHPSSPCSLRMNLHVGVLHFDPSFEPFPLLTDPVHYEPNSVDITGDKGMLDYWLTVLTDSIPTIMAKAVASEAGSPGVL